MNLLSTQDWTALLLSLQLALASTAILLLIGLPLAWWLAHSRSVWSRLADAAVALPLVLPPTVLGFYLLLAMAPNGPLGSFEMGFSFTGLVLGSVIYSLPFVVQPLRDAIAAIGDRPTEVAASLGAGPVDRFLHVSLPLLRPGLLTATVLGFCHTLGEFGVVLMIGGNIPGETRLASIAIYEHVEALDYAAANQLALVMIALSFTLLLALRWRTASVSVFRRSSGPPSS